MEAWVSFGRLVKRLLILIYGGIVFFLFVLYFNVCSHMVVSFFFETSIFVLLQLVLT